MSDNQSPVSMGAVCIDSENAGRLADFYAKLLNWKKIDDKDGWAAISSPDGTHVIGFQTVDGYLPPVWPWETGKQAQMMHLDFNVENVDAAVSFAQECGAKIADTQYFETAKTMIDPAGHPFCLCPNA